MAEGTDGKQNDQCQPSSVAMLLIITQASTPGPKISYAWYWDMSTIH